MATSNDPSGSGGGVYLHRSDATLTHNTISGNSTDGNGGGLYLYFSDATLTHNTISGNSADSGGGLGLDASGATLTYNLIQGNFADVDGGGLDLNSSSATLTHNTIRDNSTNNYGGGLDLNSSSATLTHNTIRDNSALRGGGLDLNYSPATLTHNLINGNSAHGDSGGLHLSYSDAILTHNLISGNSIPDRELSVWGGGGLFIWYSSPILTNNTIVNNIGEGVYARFSASILTNNTLAHNTGEGVYAGGSSPLITNCILWGNGGDGDLIEATATYSCIGTGETTGEGNISQDPQFVNSEDHHLQLSSPCINQGNNDAPELPGTDIDDQPRILYEVVDMGADEVSHLLDLQPDLLIKQGPTWLGNDIYNSDATDQTATGNVGSGQTRVYRARLYNDGDEETYWIKGSGGDADWTVQYYWGTAVNPAREVTTKVTSTKGWRRANVPAGGKRNFVIAVTPASGVVGDCAVLVQATSDQDPVQLDCIQAITTVPDVQPDLHLKKGPVWGGDNIYNDDGTDQKTFRKVVAGSSALCRARLENDGADKDHFYIKGPAGDADWTVQYYRGWKVDAAKEVTAEVTSADGWKRPNVAPGAFRNFLIVVTPRSGLVPGSKYVVLVGVESRWDASQQDAIKMTTKVKSE